MGTATSKKEESEVENVQTDKSKTSTEEERNEYKGDSEENKDPVVEEEIVPTEGIQVRSFIGAPIVCPPGYRLDAKGKCRKVQ